MGHDPSLWWLNTTFHGYGISPEHATPMVSTNGSNRAEDRKGNMEPVTALFKRHSFGNEKVSLSQFGLFSETHMFRRSRWNNQNGTDLGKNSGYSSHKNADLGHDL